MACAMLLQFVLMDIFLLYFICWNLIGQQQTFVLVNLILQTFLNCLVTLFIQISDVPACVCTLILVVMYFLAVHTAVGTVC